MFAMRVIDNSKSKIDDSRSMIDDYKWWAQATLQIVESLTDDSRGIIYKNNIFIIQATACGLTTQGVKVSTA